MSRGLLLQPTPVIQLLEAIRLLLDLLEGRERRIDVHERSIYHVLQGLVLLNVFNADVVGGFAQEIFGGFLRAR